MRMSTLAGSIVLAFSALSGTAAWAASEIYPVTYAGGTPPATINGALDADDDGLPQRPVDCASLTVNSTGRYAYDTVTLTNAGSNTADIVFSTTDINTRSTVTDGRSNLAGS